MSLDFAVIDFETANSSYESACQVGLALVRDGQIAGVHAWYIVPPTGLASFSPANIRIHGITPEMVIDGNPLTWTETVDRLAELIGDLPLVAHNVSFDKTVFLRCNDACGLVVPPYRWLDSVSLSRRLLRLENNKLATIIRHFSIENHSHHDAGSDAAVTAQAVLRIAADSGLGTVDELWPPAGSRSAGTSAAKYLARGYSTPAAELPQPDPNANPAHLLYGQRVAVTGDVHGFTRWEVFEAIARCGASVEKGVTKRTSVLVIGHLPSVGPDHDLASGTGKEKKAHTYRAAGQRILLLGSEDFRLLVQG